MGIPAEPALYSGFDCDFFNNGETPLVVWGSFGGIMPGDVEPTQGWQCPNGTYMMQQDDGQPCSWSYLVGAQAGYYNIKTPNAGCGLTDTFRDGAFAQWGQPAGTTFFHNAAQSPVGTKYYGGKAQFMWLPPMANPSLLLALEELNIEPGPKVFLEFFPVEANLIVVKACRLSDKTNISFKFSY